MFDLKLTDLFSTMCIGVLSLALITYFYFIYNKFFVDTKFDTVEFRKWIKETLSASYEKSGYLIIAVVAVYCLGVVAGDLTGRMTDSDSSHKTPLLRELKWLSGLKSQELARREAIVDTANNWKLTGLGNSVLRSGAIVANANHISGNLFLRDSTILNPDSAKNPAQVGVAFSKQWQKVRLSLLGDSTKNKPDSATYRLRRRFNTFLQQIYYTGKNWCFSKDHEPLNELKSIQNRIDLSRSMMLLLVFSAQILLLIIVVKCSYVFARTIKNKTFPDFKKLDTWKRLGFYYLQVSTWTMFIVIGWCSKQCYEINEDNYNKRAYGYYVSEVNRVEYLKLLHQDETPDKPKEE